MNTYQAGIDIGSTTVKLVVLDDSYNMVYGQYRRHCAKIQESLTELLQEAYALLGECRLQVRITGSGSINLGHQLGIAFTQEVVAVAAALQRVAPQTDVAIELGGEDAKIIYFKGGLDERMNGVCAGGTGSFIDQMAALLQTDAAGLNREAAHYHEIYPIAARCGVFAKTDIQPLINDGAATSDLAASIFQAVVNQTISGLACGKPIRGCVAFLGGPLHFLPELKKAFIRTLNLTPENVVDPDHSHLFAAMGAALEATDKDAVSLSSLLERLQTSHIQKFEINRLPPLFRDQTDYQAFCDRHAQAIVKRGQLEAYHGDCFLGVDAGSTTTKLAVIGQDGELLFSYYTNNAGNPVKAVIAGMEELKKQLPNDVRIVRSCSTGYGETLMQTAFGIDEGEVETVAHCTAAAFFEPQVDCVLDIGGQDMKYIKLRNSTVDTVILNEACSSGCGSFIESFANSLGYSAEEFAKLALFAENPVDLGTRCTVFMNSNVKQAQKEGASVQDISAGLAYSVIKNALFKVIKLTDAKDMGRHIVVQGGTFYNQAVLRAFEYITGASVICPDIAGIMGAFGAALLAKDRYHSQETTLVPLDEIQNVTYEVSIQRCGGCSNHCILTIDQFSNGQRHITGNRCEKGLQNGKPSTKAPNMVLYKRKRMFGYAPLSSEEAVRGEIGIPRVLNMYENYPFWATFFKKLRFKVVLSPFSSRKLYELGMESIPSESECYPAKMAHGHVQWLINHGIQTIFHPCVFYEHQETDHAQNHYNCPIVISYPENLKNNVEDIENKNIRYLRPFIAFTTEKTAADRLVRFCKETWDIPEKETRDAVHDAWAEQMQAKADIRTEGVRLLSEMEETHGHGIVLAGRPYHIDPEINHGIPELISSYGFYVFTEDSLPSNPHTDRQLRVVDQWVYHARLYSAAEFVSSRDDLELVQLNSFGCGLDAVTTDQVNDILVGSNKLYTVLKIDEVNNLGAVRIRIRSLLAAIRMRQERNVKAVPKEVAYHRAEFTKEMKKQGYTILAPQMSPIHFDILEPVLNHYGYHVDILKNDNRTAIDVGLKYVNNDACFPSITVVGQIMEAVLSGRYDTDKLAIIMSQTGGCCRASNYVGFIRKALDKAGLSHIPVISLNANGMEKNSGFEPSPALLYALAKGLVYGDLLMRCLYHVRPYELVPGSANALYEEWKEKCIRSLIHQSHAEHHAALCHDIVQAFDTFEIDETVHKPRVGIVGEILVKYMPLANNHLVSLLEKEGVEAVVPDLTDFLNYCLYNTQYKHEFLGTKWSTAAISHAGIQAIHTLRKPALDALQNSSRFEAPIPIEQIAEWTKPFLSIGNQYGEGWFLAGEMIELLRSGVPNIVCIQPFACLPNHVVGKGVIKALKKAFPEANIAAVDYDPGASEVNQLNRIKLMLAAAKRSAESAHDCASLL